MTDQRLKYANLVVRSSIKAYRRKQAVVAKLEFVLGVAALLAVWNVLALWAYFSQ